MKKVLALTSLLFFISIIAYGQANVKFYKQNQCAYVVDDGKIYESGSTKCTKRNPLYIITENKVYFHNKQNECALVVIGDRIYNGSRNKDEIGELRFIIKGNELVYPDKTNECAFIIEDNKVWYGSNNKINRKAEQILTIEGDIEDIALYMILFIISL